MQLSQEISKGIPYNYFQEDWAKNWLPNFQATQTKLGYPGDKDNEFKAKQASLKVYREFFEKHALHHDILGQKIIKWTVSTQFVQK